MISDTMQKTPRSVHCGADTRGPNQLADVVDVSEDATCAECSGHQSTPEPGRAGTEPELAQGSLNFPDASDPIGPDVSEQPERPERPERPVRRETAAPDELASFQSHAAETGTTATQAAAGALPGSSPFRFYTIDGLRRRPPRPWLIEQLLPAGTLTLLYGDPGTTKSFGALSMALSVATGTPWLGYAVHQGPVLYIAAEGDTALMPRIDAWSKAHNVAVDDATPFIIETVPVDLFRQDSATSAQALIAAIRAQPVFTRPTGSSHLAFVVVDTFARCFPEGDENLAKDMNRAVKALDHVRMALGCHVLVVHHAVKGSGGSRGSSALPGAADTGLKVTRESSKTGRTDRITLHVEKQKDAQELAPLDITLKTIALGATPKDTSCVWALRTVAEPTAASSAASSGNTGHTHRQPSQNAQSSDAAAAGPMGDLTANERRAVEGLRGFPGEGATLTEWHEATGIPITTLKRMAKSLKQRGYILRDQTIKRPARWKVAEVIGSTGSPGTDGKPISGEVGENTADQGKAA